MKKFLVNTLCLNRELYRSELKLFNSEDKNIDSVLTVMNKEIPTFIQDTLFDFYKSIIKMKKYSTHNSLLNSTHNFNQTNHSF